MDGQAGGRADAWMDGWTDRRADGQTDRHRQTDRQILCLVLILLYSPRVHAHNDSGYDSVLTYLIKLLVHVL